MKSPTLSLFVLMLLAGTAALACRNLDWLHLPLGQITEERTLGQHLDEQYGQRYPLDTEFQADVTYQRLEGGRYAWTHTVRITKKCGKTFSQSIYEDTANNGGGGGLPEEEDPGGPGFGDPNEGCFTDRNGWACSETPTGETCEYFAPETICGIG